jgi:hypothetical protein
VGLPGTVRAALVVVVLTAAPVAGADRLVEGELVRVDLGKKTLVVRPSSGAPLEVDIKVDAATAISASGRALRLDELKTGERGGGLRGREATGCRAVRVRPAPRATRSRRRPRPRVNA